MTVRAAAFGVALLVAGALITIGTGQYSRPAGLIVAGGVVGLWAWLVLSE